MDLHLDAAALKRTFYAKSREIHPDHQDTPDASSEMAAALNNEAFRVLSDEDLRIRHILSLHGMASLDQEQLPESFLMEMMEINEQIMELDGDEAKTASIMQEVDAMGADLNASLDRLRQIWPTDPTQIPSTLTQLKLFVIKKRYLLPIRENLSKFAPS